ncbi:hypothetical protein F5887DRAFT_991447 [Amanita rubescens]|nr:hypothetical protein F5887DRAFT_991447 [Amanita rubescens]
MFAPLIMNLMERYTENPQEAIGDGWFGPWNAILTTLFPPAQRYFVTPHRRPLDPDSHLIIEVVKLTTTAPITLRSVLIIAIGNAQHLKPGIPVPERELNQQIDTAFAATARSKVYWIESIGPHWRYGVKEDDGQDVQPLIAWHDTTHDHASFDDFQTLTGLVAAL